MTETELLTTGEAARRLASSRQHVVDLCMRGDLEFVWVGSHRRIPEHAIKRILSPDRSLDRDALRSLWLHRAVVGHLVQDPEAVLSKAREKVVERLNQSDYPGSPSPYYLRWLEALDAGVEVTARLLTDPGEEACALRSCSPFTGVLPASERSRVLEAFQQCELP